MKKNEKVTLVIPTLTGGGAEKNFKKLANFLYDKGYRVKVLCLLEEKKGYLLRDGIEFESLNMRKLAFGFFKFIRHLINDKSDFYIFTLTEVNILYGGFTKLIKFKKRVILRESNLPSREVSNRFFKKLFIKFVYNNVDAVVAQSNDMKDDLVNVFFIDKDKVVVINNPVDYFDKAHLHKVLKERKKSDKIKIISVGRLHRQKRYDRAIETINYILKLGYDVDYIIYGKGPLENDIKSIVEEFGLEKKVKLVGFVDQIETEIVNSDILLISSDYEGFPNVVVESLSLGIPVLAYEFPGGINELIVDGFNGAVINSLDDINRKMLDSVLYMREKRFKEISDHTFNRFSEDKLFNYYLDILVGKK